MSGNSGFLTGNVQIIISIISAFAVLPKAVNAINLLVGKLKYYPDHKELDKIEERIRTGTLSAEALEYIKEQQNRIVFRMCYNIDAGPEMRKVLHRFQHEHQSEISWSDLRTAYPRLVLVKHKSEDAKLAVFGGRSFILNQIYSKILIWYTKLIASICLLYSLLLAFGHIDIGKDESPVLFVLFGLVLSGAFLSLSFLYEKMQLPFRILSKVREIVANTVG